MVVMNAFLTMMRAAGERRRFRGRTGAPAATLLAVAVVLAGCGRGENAKTDSATATTPAAVANGPHTHGAPPHGGMLVELGDGAYHLEVVVDTGKTTVTAYVLDAAAKEPVRLSQGRIDLKMIDLVEGNAAVFTVLAAKASARTGETLDNTATFLGFVPELKGRGKFRAVVQRVAVGDRVFTDIPLSYPAEPRP